MAKFGFQSVPGHCSCVTKPNLDGCALKQMSFLLVSYSFFKLMKPLLRNRVQGLLFINLFSTGQIVNAVYISLTLPDWQMYKQNLDELEKFNGAAPGSRRRR